MKKIKFRTFLLPTTFKLLFLYTGIANAQANTNTEVLLPGEELDKGVPPPKYYKTVGSPKPITVIIREKKAEIDELITMAAHTPESELTSEESLKTRKALVLKIEDLLTELKLHSSDLDKSYYVELLPKTLFNSQAYLAEWKALSAKAALDQQNFLKTIQDAKDAVQARHCALNIAKELGWTKEAEIQADNTRWPVRLENQAKKELRKEIGYLKNLSEQIELKINSLGEKNAYTKEGLITRKNYIKMIKSIEKKHSEIGDIEKHQEVIFQRLSHEAEAYTIQAKLLLDLGLDNEALFYAEKAISKREEASHQASILGWTLESIFQLEFAGWPSRLEDEAKRKL